MPKKVPLSVFIITQNEEHHIKACLESVQWADEIIVVDAESLDQTVRIARQFTDKVFTRPWCGFARQKQYALELCSHQWVMSLDADERVRPGLKDEVETLLVGSPEHNGYRIARRTYFLNRWIEHCGWYPGYQVRLFKKEKSHVSLARVHEGFLVEGTVGTLQNDIDHFSHPTLFHSLEKLNRYSSLEALDRLERKRVRWFDFVTHPLSAFLIKYLRQKGFLDGLHGFLLCWIAAFLKMVMYMKIWWFQRLDREQLLRVKDNMK